MQAHYKTTGSFVEALGLYLNSFWNLIDLLLCSLVTITSILRFTCEYEDADSGRGVGVKHIYGDGCPHLAVVVCVSGTSNPGGRPNVARRAFQCHPSHAHHSLVACYVPTRVHAPPIASDGLHRILSH